VRYTRLCAGHRYILTKLNARQLIESIISPDYLVRRVPRRSNEDEAYEVAKFTGAKRPASVYRVSKVKGKWRCDCPGFRRTPSWNAEEHKHIRLVKGWLKLGQPDSFLDSKFQAFARTVML